MEHEHKSDDSIISRVTNYISEATRVDLPEKVIVEAKHHILDTIAAAISGSRLKPGRLAASYVATQGGAAEAQVVGTPIITSAVNTAFANGMMAHADETDDSHARSFTHPGSSIVPAALAMAEREQADGSSYLRAVVAGYDIGCRITQAIGVDNLRKISRSTHSTGGVFGAAAAAAALGHLTSEQIGCVLSYAAQQAGGITYWMREMSHVEKAFVFSGMAARNGVSAVSLIQAGFTGVKDPFSGERNFYNAYTSNAVPGLLAAELGSRYEIMFTNIKKYSVGSPIQAPLEALLLLVEKHGLAADNVESITVRLGDRAASRTVNNLNMPDISLTYLLSAALLDRKMTFSTAHSVERMRDPVIQELQKRIVFFDDPELVAANIMRQGIVEVTTKDGSRLREHVVRVRGTEGNPMTGAEVEEKCQDLMAPVLGEGRTLALIDRIWNIEQVKNMRELRPLLSA